VGPWIVVAVLCLLWVAAVVGGRDSRDGRDWHDGRDGDGARGGRDDVAGG
jgi:hypothetical protein